MVDIRPSQFDDDSIDAPNDRYTDDYINRPKPPIMPAAPAWSEFQERIFDFVRDQSNGSAVVIAVAGSGKTTTIIEAAKRLSPQLSCAFVAFNKSIAEGLKTKLPAHVRSSTLNSLGFGAWRRHIGEHANTIRVDGNKTRTLAQDIIPPQHYALYGKSMPRLIGIAKAIGVVPIDLDGTYGGLVDDDESVWSDIVDTYSLDFEADMDNPDHVAGLVRYARAILRQSITVAEHLIDFDDQLYMPVITGARFWQNDIIFVDEAQDLNRIQRVMLRRALRSNGRLIAVGDPNQAIYGFRGADHTAIDMIKEDFRAVELPLTISYRCPKAVVAEARRWVSHITSHESAAEGTVQTLARYTSDTFGPTDVIVCRNTKPLIGLAYEILRDGVACKVRGRDIGAGLISLIKKFKTNDLDQFDDKFNAYVAKKTMDWLAKGKDDLAQRLQDQYDTIMIFVTNLTPGATVADLMASIERLFTDNGPQVLTLSTIHKAKGLEWRRVFILDPDLMPSKYAKTEGAKQQERNLQYVAATRAKSDLTYISSKGHKPRKESGK